MIRKEFAVIAFDASSVWEVAILSCTSEGIFSTSVESLSQSGNCCVVKKLIETLEDDKFFCSSTTWGRYRGRVARFEFSISYNGDEEIFYEKDVYWYIHELEDISFNNITVEFLEVKSKRGSIVAR